MNYDFGESPSITQTSMKSMLAYSSIGQIGYVNNKTEFNPLSTYNLLNLDHANN
jgi:formate hydrogenlyase subunit 3/multisubunit Na+/H+ antiporter MnhD subunit